MSTEMYTRMMSPVASVKRRGRVMNSATWGLVLAAAIAGCHPAGAADQRLMKEGRTYTAWLYGSECNKLWDRFSPEMRQTFGSVADLANFASRAVKNLGTEQGQVDEQV